MDLGARRTGGNTPKVGTGRLRKRSSLIFNPIAFFVSNRAVSQSRLKAIFTSKQLKIASDSKISKLFSTILTRKSFKMEMTKPDVRFSFSTYLTDERS